MPDLTPEPVADPTSESWPSVAVWRGDRLGMRTVMITLRSVPASDDGSGADPDPLADPLWPLGDEVATALVGLLEVELRGRGLRWRVLARDRLEVGRTDAAWPG